MRRSAPARMGGWSSSTTTTVYDLDLAHFMGEYIMAKQATRIERDIPAALKRLQDQWSRMQTKPGLDRIAKAAAMSNNSVLDLVAPPGTPRYKKMLARITKAKAVGTTVRTWARLAMQLSLVLDPLLADTGQTKTRRSRPSTDDSIRDWVRLDEWGLSPAEFAKLLDEARVKVDHAQVQVSGTISATVVRVGIVPLVYLADDIRPDRERTSSNASFLGTFARMVLRSVKPDFEFTYHPAKLRELNPPTDDAPSGAVKVGAFGIVARERDTHEHIPIPGWSYKFACMGPDIPQLRAVAESRRIFSTRSAGLVYVTLKGSSPASFLSAMFGGNLPQRHLRHEGNDEFDDYKADLIADAYADELIRARSAIRGDDNGSIPLLVIDDAMADEVARRIADQYSAALLWPQPQFIDLLRGLPEGPAVPICIQVRHSDEDLVRLLKHAIVGDGSNPGEVFTLGALPMARTYARALVWILSHYAYDYAKGPGTPASDSLLVRVQAYYRRCVSQQNVERPQVPMFCRLWNFNCQVASPAVQPQVPTFCKLLSCNSQVGPPAGFFHLLADELVSRLVPDDMYKQLLSDPSDASYSSAIKKMLTLVLPGCGSAIDAWSQSRLISGGVRLPETQSDWRGGPAEADREMPA